MSSRWPHFFSFMTMFFSPLICCNNVMWLSTYFNVKQGRSREMRESEAGFWLQAVSTKPDARLELRSSEIMTWAKVRCLTNWATQVPPTYFFFSIKPSLHFWTESCLVRCVIFLRYCWFESTHILFIILAQMILFNMNQCQFPFLEPSQTTLRK